jgi:hypothetical protein
LSGLRSSPAAIRFPDDVRVDLELLDERRFGNGVVYLRYGVTDHGPRGSADGRSS